MTTKFLGFDHDFAVGKVGEGLVEELLTGGKKVEVKTDLQWKKTGNIFIEAKCWQNSSSSWADSGINATEADYWAFVLQNSVFIFPTNLIKTACSKYGRYINGGDFTNPSEGYLIRLDELLEENKTWSLVTDLNC